MSRVGKAGRVQGSERAVGDEGPLIQRQGLAGSLGMPGAPREKVGLQWGSELYPLGRAGGAVSFSKGLKTTYPTCGYLHVPAGTGAGARFLPSAQAPSTPHSRWLLVGGSVCLGLSPASRTPRVAPGRLGSWGSTWAGLSLPPLGAEALRGWQSGPLGVWRHRCRHWAGIQAGNAEGSKAGPWLVPSPLQLQARLRLRVLGSRDWVSVRGWCCCNIYFSLPPTPTP